VLKGSDPTRDRTHGARRRTYLNWSQLRSMATTLDRQTTITVTERTRRLLETVKGEGETFDETIQALLEETFFDDEFYKEIERRWRTEKRIPGPKVLQRAGRV
jgi:hypothetical protein